MRFYIYEQIHIQIEREFNREVVCNCAKIIKLNRKLVNSCIKSWWSKYIVGTFVKHLLNTYIWMWYIKIQQMHIFECGNSYKKWVHLLNTQEKIWPTLNTQVVH